MRPSWKSQTAVSSLFLIPRKSFMISGFTIICSVKKRITYNTYNAYRNIIENYLLPKLGHKKLDALQRRDLVKALSGIPHPGVLRTAAGVVTASLCYARKHNYLSRDIYTGISSEVKQPCLKKKKWIPDSRFIPWNRLPIFYICVSSRNP